MKTVRKEQKSYQRKKTATKRLNNLFLTKLKLTKQSDKTEKQTRILSDSKNTILRQKHFLLKNNN
jgi:hypothetical protein